jgi:hypothetical protein
MGIRAMHSSLLVVLPPLRRPGAFLVIRDDA